MKRTALLAMLACLLISGLALAQEISRQDFIKSEWEMKLKFHKAMLERQEGGDLTLDQADFDVKYWDLKIDVTDISGQVIWGKVVMTSQVVVSSISQIDYNFHSQMVVDSVRMGGAAVPFTRPSGFVHITLDRAYADGELFTTTIYYHGHPPGSGFGSFSWNTHNGQPIISSLSEPEGAREWWPCKDIPHDKADSADVRIVTPSNLVGTSNGKLIETIDNGNGTLTFHWKISYPITTYLICVSVTNYQSFTNWYVNALGDSMPVTNYVYPEHFSAAQTDLGITPNVIGIYAGMFGEYPFLSEKYGHSIFPWGGGMEHQCNTSYGSMLIRGDHYYDWILVHELSHQWFGDMITCDTWPDVWMNEGFASYCEALYIEHQQGAAAYRNYMTGMNAVYDPSGPIYNPTELFDGNTVYNKGSWALHMLRGVMGDSLFMAGMYGYANDPAHKYGTVQTRQFQHIMESYYGDSLGWFFDEWVWGQNRPIYRYSWAKHDLGDGRYDVYLHIAQTQLAPAPTVFTMPIQISLRVNGVDTMVSVWDDARTDDFQITVVGNPTNLTVDPLNWILKEVSSELYRLNVITLNLPDGRQDSSYDEYIEALGGVPPYHYSVSSGQMPDGLALDGSTGEIFGVPLIPGSSSFTIRCYDSSEPPMNDYQDYQVEILEVAGCVYIPGNSNGVAPFNGIDVSFSVNYLKGIGPAPPDTCSCPPWGNILAAADANGSCGFNGIDVSYSVNYLKGMGPAPLGCADCLPGRQSR